MIWMFGTYISGSDRYFFLREASIDVGVKGLMLAIRFLFLSFPRSADSVAPNETRKPAAGADMRFGMAWLALSPDPNSIRPLAAANFGTEKAPTGELPKVGLLSNNFMALTSLVGGECMLAGVCWSHGDPGVDSSSKCLGVAAVWWSTETCKSRDMGRFE